MFNTWPIFRNNLFEIVGHVLFLFDINMPKINTYNNNMKQIKYHK